MKNENAMLLGALILGILFADTLKPVANNMLGKLVLLLGICYLANKHVVLGLLGALLYISLNNTLLEGNEDEKDPAEDDETEVVEGPDGFKEGEGALYKGNPNTWFHDNCNYYNKHGVYSIFSYAEIMFESVTTFDTYVRENEEIISFTEKHFQLFATLTIPLIIDSEPSVNYLKKWGFRFFEAELKPLTTDKRFITEENKKIKGWLEKLVNYNFKNIWHEDLNPHQDSILISNFNKLHDIYNRGLHITLTEYKILEALNHPYLEKFQWDTNVRYLKQNDLL